MASAATPCSQGTKAWRRSHRHPPSAFRCESGGDTDRIRQLAEVGVIVSLRGTDGTVDEARGEGLNLNVRHTEALPAGKSFEVLRFMKDAL